jgi:hypothetical protein
VGERQEMRPLESLGLKAYHLFGKLLPIAVKRRLATEVYVLARSMIQKALGVKDKMEIIPSSDIL